MHIRKGIYQNTVSINVPNALFSNAFQYTLSIGNGQISRTFTPCFKGQHVLRLIEFDILNISTLHLPYYFLYSTLLPTFVSPQFKYTFFALFFKLVCPHFRCYTLSLSSMLLAK